MLIIDKYLLKNNKGVMLAELVVVVFIWIVLFSAIASFVPTEKKQLIQAAEELRKDIYHIQRQALVEGVRYKIVFDEEALELYYVLKEENKRFKAIKTVYFQKGVLLYDTNAEALIIEFSPKGTISKANATILVNESYNVAVTCTVGTGKVNIKEVQKNDNMYRLIDFKEE